MVCSRAIIDFKKRGNERSALLLKEIYVIARLKVSCADDRMMSVKYIKGKKDFIGGSKYVFEY